MIKYTTRFNRLWMIYDNTLAHGKKGSKFTALKSFEKYSEDEQDRIIFDTQALMRHFKQQVKPDRLPHLSTWLNQRYFEQEIPSATEKREVQELEECSVPDCHAPIHGSSFSVCSFHVPNAHDHLLREAWTRTGIIKKGNPNYAEECRAYCKERMSIIRGKI